MSPRTQYLTIQVVTAARIPGALIAIPFVLAESWIVVFVIYALCELTDVLDGYLARRLGQVSRFGKLFDPYCDSVYRLSVFFTFAMAGGFPQPLFWVVVWVMAVRDVTVSYGRMAALARGHVLSARSSGKLKALIQAGASLGVVAVRTVELDAGVVSSVTELLGLAVIGVTLWSMIDYAWAVLRFQRSILE